MEKDTDDASFETNPESDNNQSLVGKLKKNVTEIISNTPLSKWFHKQKQVATPTVRRRQDDSDDEDLQEFQPPAKRSKLPPTKETLSLNVSEVLSPISSNNARNPSRNFPEPIAGPSGYHTRKILNSTAIFNDTNRSIKFADPKISVNSSEATNKDDYSDSEESTSGYSSGRVGSKEVVSQESSKQTSPSESSPRKIRSLFQTSGLFTRDRSLSPNANSSLSSRAPSFNPSSFASATFEDRTLSTKRILNSPFYNGRTIYGGASAYGRNTRRMPHEIQKLLRKSVSIKPTNISMEKGNAPLGKTARRILDALEQYSSPISDAKKIPLSSKRQKVDGSLTKYIGANPYTVRELRTASNKELHVPSIGESTRFRLDQQKSKLQDSTETARQIATKFISDSYNIPAQSDSGKHVSKIKNKITSVRKKIIVEETVSEVHLPSISLPIKELPKFDVVVPVPRSEPSSTQKQSNAIVRTPEPTKPTELPQMELKSGDQSNVSEFKFSAPLILARCVKPLKALNNFTFSEPLVKKRRSIHSNSDSDQGKLVDSVKLKRNNGENIFSVDKEAAGSDSVGNIMDKFKPKSGTWECSMCLIRNQSEQTKCAACETPKATSKISNDTKQSSVPPISLKPQENTWECPTCMIRNKDSLQKCAACEEAKPDKAVPKTLPKVMPDTGFQGAAPVNHSGTTSFNPFNAQARWTCSTCLITNKEELTKCAACETSRSTSKDVGASKSTLGTVSKKKSDKWECSVCMVPNSSESDKCVCCETPNPNKSASKTILVDSSSKVSSFNFGIDKATANSFTFGIPAGAQQTSSTSNASLVFGDKKVESNGTVDSFVFGVPAKTETAAPQEPPKTESENLPKPSTCTTTTTSSTSFVFGSKPPTNSDDQKPADTTQSFVTPAVPLFQFGASFKNDQQQKESTEPKPTFNFAPSPGKSESKTAPTPTFSSLAKADTEKKTERVNPLLKPDEKLPAKASVAPSGFSFGLTKAPSSTSILPTPGNTAVNQSTLESSPNKRSRSEDDDPAPASKTPLLSFKPPTVTNGDINTNLFAPKSTVGESKPVVGGFNFNFASKTNAAAPKPIVPSFGSNVNQADNSKSTEPTFKFGSNSSNSPNKSNGFNFGASTPAFGAKPTTGAPDFTFGASKPSTQSTFSENASTKPGGFTFNTKTEPKPFIFNATNTKPTESPFSSGFGASPAPPSNPGSTFGFNQSPAPTFGGATAQQKSTFGATSATSNPFGASNNQQTSVFGAASSQGTATTFGSTNTAQNSVPNGMFNFGSAASSNKAGFSFGSPSSVASSGGFNFGSATTNPSASSSGGFNFSAGSVPSFDGNAKPTFNFTGGAGLTAFSAPPVQEGGPMTQRKIKKAIRRTVR